MNETLPLVNDVLTIIALVASPLVAVAGFVIRRSLASRGDLDTAVKRIDALEAVADQHPSSGELHALSLKISDTNGELRALAASLGGFQEKMNVMSTQLDRMNDYLLNNRSGS